MAETKNIYSILRRRYPEAEYALMAEVSNDAGFSRSNSADYIIVGLWPSRGLHVSGIELKTYRSDWLRELKKPDKAESVFKFCDFFWLLTTDESIANLEEIPANWGWMCVKGGRITVKKEAPRLEPLPLSRGFISAMLKRASDKTNFVHVDTIEDRIKDAALQAVLVEQRNGGN